MSKHIGIWTLILSIVASLFYAPIVFADDYSNQNEGAGNISLFIGSKTLRTTDWRHTSKQIEDGIKFDIKPRDWPVSLVCDILASTEIKDHDFLSGGTPEVTSKTYGKNIGIRWDSNRPKGVNVFCGLGLSFIDVTTEVNSGISDSGSGNGIWGEVGINIIIGHFTIGLDIISSSAKMDIGGINGKVSCLDSGFFIGYHW